VGHDKGLVHDGDWPAPAVPAASPAKRAIDTAGHLVLPGLIDARMGQPTECPHAVDKDNIAQRTTTGLAVYLSQRQPTCFRD
jgi:hypothetical protein